tara:strand:+ start:23128 stop:23313 length:186 start_codon:yes stop_codon:yes gene_type:complete
MTTNNKQGRSPLRCIPKAATVRERLQKVLREAAELKILLRTAEEIEQERNAPETREGHSDA